MHDLTLLPFFQTCQKWLYKKVSIKIEKNESFSAHLSQRLKRDINQKLFVAAIVVNF